MVTAVKAFDEGHRAHEMVSGERKMERMQSHLEELWENMKRIESGLDEVKSTHRRDSLYSKQKTDELDAKMKQLEEDNAQLKSTVGALKKELEDTKQKLKEALDEAAMLREDNSNLANQMSEERAELRESLEEQTSQWRTRQEQYERELREVRADLATVRKGIQDYREMNTTDSPGGTTSHSQGSETGEWIWKQKLGSGGFGEVFAAERRGCPDRFAAKRITMRDSDLIDKQEQIVSAFFKEMKALQECRHPRVVRYIDRAFETVKSGVHFYLIMEYMSEGSLSDVIKRDGKLDELKAKRFTGQLLDGLLYLHQRNIIHRDIKCSNILLDGSGDIKLADFGCVKFKKSKVDSGAKMTGTAWWMAPELIPKDNQSPTPSEKSDVWYVGISLQVEKSFLQNEGGYRF
ncbi:Serine/threonine-protein kinase shk2 [Geodia barretti]|uniref:Serine/threonine-protein kinase shk2 n=1 Tax=Geodia barretti TaxID=519541 RepID=A0AA35X163_GEOBA|nr:Serine/threonine-protein kinase shk2 [Geodia barretti]